MPGRLTAACKLAIFTHQGGFLDKHLLLNNEWLVLVAIVSKREVSTSMEIIKEMERLAKATAPRSTIFTTIGRLVKKGLVNSEHGPGKSTRRRYIPTEAGIAACVQLRDAAALALWGHYPNSAVHGKPNAEP
jgi:DNA-binding MarR family transcriptional regulator